MPRVWLSNFKFEKSKQSRIIYGNEEKWKRAKHQELEQLRKDIDKIDGLWVTKQKIVKNLQEMEWKQKVGCCKYKGKN